MYREKLTPKTWVHVGLSEVIIKKGHELLGEILSKDSVIHYEFYSEIINTYGP